MNKTDFAGQVVWITGASSGIGEALAAQFAQEQSQLVLSARRQSELERVRDRCIQAGASEVLVLPLDVTDQAAFPAAVEQVKARFGRIDMLVNNAGLSQRSTCVNTDMAVYRTLFEVDVMGQIALTKAVLPGMLAQGKGHIAVTSSVAGKIGAPQRTGYCAAKHAVMGFFDALRAEVVDQGIRVTTITPGFIRTAMTEVLPDAQKEALNARIPMGRMGEGEEIGAAVAYLASREAGYVTGQTLHVNGGMAMIS